MRCVASAVVCFAVAILRLSAVTLDASWRIVPPPADETGVGAAIGQAARELSRALEEGAGLRIPVVSAEEVPTGARTIWLGIDSARAAGIAAEDLAGFENVIAEKDGCLYLFGADRPGRIGKKNLTYSHCLLPTVRAVTRFMERYLDVRFLAPGWTGTDVPKIRKAEVPDGTFSREKPMLLYGTGRRDTLMFDLANGVFGCGMFHSYGGATYDAACPPEKYFASHPEYFGLIAGKRTASPRACVPLCVSNPAVEELIVGELLRRFDEGCEICQLGQQDGWRACECDRCRAFCGVEPAEDWGEKLWVFHARIARRIEKLRPGKTVLILSYGPTAEHPPRTFRRFPSNVMIELCHPTEEKFRAWEGIEVPQGFAAYTYLWGCYPSLGFTAKHTYAHCAAVARMLAHHRVRGLYRCGYGELCGMEGPSYWVFNRTLGDPVAETGALVDEYCRRMYGPAAKAMRTFHDILDARLALAEAVPENVWTPLERLAHVYGGETLKRMEDWLAYAERLAGTYPQRRRLKLVRAEFDYAKNLGTIAALYGAWRVCPRDTIKTELNRLLEERRTILDGIFRGGRTVPPFEAWPEVRFFGGRDTSQEILEANGRLGAVAGEPLNWMRKTSGKNGKGF